MAFGRIFVAKGEKAMRRIGMIMLLALSGVICNAQQLAEMELIMKLEGVDSPEELDQYDVERMEDMLRRPIRINQASDLRMRESGLFSHYQMVSLSDYRSRHGDVLSFSELSAVDGFGKDFVDRIAPFISLESGRIPGSAKAGDVTGHELTARASIKEDQAEGGACSYGLKYRVEVSDRLAAGLAVSRPYQGAEAICGNVRLNFRQGRGMLIAGDFNARFGQGLALWNGMGIGGLSSPSAFMKRASYLSPSSSFSGSQAMRGIAAGVALRHAKISSFIALDGDAGMLKVMPAVNVSWFRRHGQAGITHYSQFATGPYGVYIPDIKTSADFASCIAGVDIFAECAYDWAFSAVAALAGAVIPVTDDIRMAVMLRYYPPTYSPTCSASARSTTKSSNEHSVSLSAEMKSGGWVSAAGSEGYAVSSRRLSGTFSMDAAYFPEPKDGENVHDLQLKAATEWTLMALSTLKIKVRLSERVRSWGNMLRTDARADLAYSSGRLMMNLRMNAVWSSGLGLLGYAEAGYKSSECALYLRQGAFFVDDWDDRIYSYERDAPGSFSVPAYYGRGVWTALTGSWRFARWGRMYARASYKAYPFMIEKKPGRAELKLQFIFQI